MTKLINLGDKARDTITGYEGVVVCESQWLHGCRRLTMQSQALKDGKPVDNWTCDEGQLELVLAKAAKPGRGLTGGDSPVPSRNPDPAR